MIKTNEFSDRKSTPHGVYCDACKQFIGYCDDKTLEYMGFPGLCDVKRFCDSCWPIIFNRSRGEIPSLSPLKQESKEEIVTKEIIMTNASSTKMTGSEINWADIDALITGGQCKLSVLAVKYNTTTTNLKTIFNGHYGDRIVARKGRNGGIYWTNSVASPSPETK